MERFKLGAFITNLGKFNEGEIVGEWITFPIKQEDGVPVMLNDYQNVDELKYLVFRGYYNSERIYLIDTYSPESEFCENWELPYVAKCKRECIVIE